MAKRRPEWVRKAAERAEKRSSGEHPMDDTEEAPVYSPIIDPPETGPADYDEMPVRIYDATGARGSVGRPELYKPEYCHVALELALNGAIDEEIADELGVHVRTLYRWYAKYPEFRQSMLAGKEACDERVVRTLYKRAIGYQHTVAKIMQHEGSPVVVAHLETVLPDVTAMRHWLNNRRPREWRDAEPTGGGNVFVNLWQAISEKRAEPIKLIADDSQPTSEAA